MTSLQSVQNALPADHYRITVTSTAIPAYAGLIANYGDGVSRVWCEGDYKLELHESLRELEPTTGDKVVFIKKFDRHTSSEEAIEWGKSHGYRPAFPCEREAFSKANPDIQRKFWIVDLGSFLVDDGGRYVPVLCGSDGGRDLGRYLFGNEWHADVRFLFVRE
ncbi:hypothetical protein IPH19_02965 [Candidatus Uhrbacteria bacterium]|nr:MAG: hypothetical protein IPH19_02965 [Candidatus Uhrbacteria bacterium]